MKWDYVGGHVRTLAETGITASSTSVSESGLALDAHLTGIYRSEDDEFSASFPSLNDPFLVLESVFFIRVERKREKQNAIRFPDHNRASTESHGKVQY